MTATNDIVFKPIGVIHSPFSDVEGMPIQPIGAVGVKGSIELPPEFEPGLKDLNGFSHLILIYCLHGSKGYSLQVVPFLDDTLRGVFATRSPKRPNPIGLSVVRLTGIERNILFIEDVDILDGTPLLDIKPYVPLFDSHEVGSCGWFEQRAKHAVVTRADSRFVDPDEQTA
jgi:tRNA-Thr(GGU) m(6)t(6)A37 methyltransferase TsaA